MRKNKKGENVDWDYDMFYYMFKRIKSQLGPFKNYPEKQDRRKISFSKKETTLCSQIAKELTALSWQDISTDSVMWAYFMITKMPTTCPTQQMVNAMQAAYNSGWLDNHGMRRLKEMFIERGTLIDLGDYYASKK